MSSPVTLSGFNNIDFGSIVTALMQQASEPLTALQTRQDSINSQIKTMASLGNRVSALKAAADDLADAEQFTAFSSSTSDNTAITSKTGTGAMAGHYDVQVLDLARAQVTATNSATADANTTIVASGGSMTIGGKTVNITGDVTLTGLAKAINNTKDMGVMASVVRSGANAYRLVLTSETTGQEGAFTLTNALTGGTSAVTFTDTDHDGTTGGDTADNAVQATNAKVLVNNIEAQSSTNEFSEAIPGVTFTVLKKDPAATIGLDVSANADALTASVNKFVSAYNDMANFMSDQNTAAGKGDETSIGHSPVLRQLRNEIRGLLLKSTGALSIKNLSQAGIEFTPGGQLKLNSKVFTAAVQDHPADIEALFTSKTGVFASLSASMKTYSRTGGFLSATKDRLNSQVKGLDSQIASMQARLAKQKLSLQQEFSATDSLMSSLKSQSSSLSSIGGSYSTL
ncbi:MAG: flagellar filament capping protein FliD [Acidobacteriota bacterium]